MRSRLHVTFSAFAIYLGAISYAASLCLLMTKTIALTISASVARPEKFDRPPSRVDQVLNLQNAAYTPPPQTQPAAAPQAPEPALNIAHLAEAMDRAEIGQGDFVPPVQARTAAPVAPGSRAATKVALGHSVMAPAVPVRRDEWRTAKTSAKAPQAMKQVIAVSRATRHVANAGGEEILQPAAVTVSAQAIKIAKAANTTANTLKKSQKPASVRTFASAAQLTSPKPHRAHRTPGELMTVALLDR